MARKIKLTDARIDKLKAGDVEYMVWDTRIAGFGLRVRPSGHKSYVYHRHAEGQSRKFTLGPVALGGVDEARRDCMEVCLHDGFNGTVGRCYLAHPETLKHRPCRSHAVNVTMPFMDLSGTESLHRASPAGMLAKLARRVEDELSITVSIGLSYNKFLAKIASDLDKPRGFAVIGRSEARAFLAGKPVGLLWGVGTAMQKRLERDGITLIGGAHPPRRGRARGPLRQDRRAAPPMRARRGRPPGRSPSRNQEHLVGFIVTNLSRPAERVVAFYNQRGTAEQWIKEGKNAIKWTRLSCRSLRNNAVWL